MSWLSRIYSRFFRNDLNNKRLYNHLDSIYQMLDELFKFKTDIDQRVSVLEREMSSTFKELHDLNKEVTGGIPKFNMKGEFGGLKKKVADLSWQMYRVQRYMSESAKNLDFFNRVKEEKIEKNHRSSNKPINEIDLDDQASQC
jgi:hypothetical protein